MASEKLEHVTSTRINAQIRVRCHPSCDLGPALLVMRIIFFNKSKYLSPGSLVAAYSGTKVFMVQSSLSAD